MIVRTALAALVSLSIVSLDRVARAQTAESETPTVATPQATDDNAALLARSQSLSAEDQNRARQLFSTGFQLWQAGDFGAAEAAFRDGLAIDPANAAANFYYGDVLLRRQDPTSEGFLRRAVALGAGSPEAYRAQAALAARVSVADALTGAWDLEFACPYLTNTRGRIEIAEVDVDARTFAARDGWGHQTRQPGHFSDTDISWTIVGGGIFGNARSTYRARWTSPTSMEGEFQLTAQPCRFTAHKR